MPPHPISAIFGRYARGRGGRYANLGAGTIGAEFTELSPYVPLDLLWLMLLQERERSLQARTTQRGVDNLLADARDRRRERAFDGFAVSDAVHEVLDWILKRRFQFVHW